MDQSMYIAHTAEGDRIQTVQEHLNGTAKLCASFAGAFGAEDVGRLCGMAHDIGKYSAGFQRRIRENGPKVDHATAGAIECRERENAYAALCVMGHHSGLPNVGTDDDLADTPTFFGRLNRYGGAKAGVLYYKCSRQTPKNLV